MIIASLRICTASVCIAVTVLLFCRFSLGGKSEKETEDMSLMSVDQNYQKVVKGAVLLIAVIFDVVSKRSGKLIVNQ